MPLTPAQLSLVHAASATINGMNPDPAASATTVGSATLCSDGRVFTGINMFHFSGGPCAENTAVANATAAGVAFLPNEAFTDSFILAASQSPGIGDGATLVAVVAVANGERGVISPCGRCRQLLLDYYPDIQVIIKDGEDLRMARIQELLPFAYVSRKFAPYVGPKV